MDQQKTLETALATMQYVFDAGEIELSAMDGPTPCASFSVAGLIDHVLDTHAMLVVAAGGEPLATDGTFGERHRAAVGSAVDQWSARGTDGTVDLGGNELPATFAISLHALEAYVHAWDLARALGRPFDPPTGLTDRMAEFAGSFISDDVRGGDADAPYAAEVAVEPDADPVDRLIAFTGRDPRWRA